MAKILVVLLFLAVVFSSAEAQRNVPVGVFTTMEACEASSWVYTPSFLSGHKPLGMGERLVTLAQRQCGWMLVAGGRYAIVGQSADTQMVLDANGNIVRRWDCGNGVRGFIVPAVPTTPPAGPVASPPAGVTKNDPAPAPQVNVSVLFTEMSQAAANTTAPRRLGFWCFRGVGEGLGCTAMAVAAYLGIKEILRKDNDEPETTSDSSKTGPGVTSDSTKTVCTGMPCPGSPIRAAPMGLMIDPISRGVGLRIALPRRW
ncbi:MAG: hypothetical protein WC783_01480 [Candidatus Paceibacterota bacterium]|jgi:hypothetical protein